MSNFSAVRSHSAPLGGSVVVGSARRSDAAAAHDCTGSWFNEALNGESRVLRAPASPQNVALPQVLTERFIASLCAS